MSSNLEEGPTSDDGLLDIENMPEMIGPQSPPPSFTKPKKGDLSPINPRSGQSSGGLVSTAVSERSDPEGSHSEYDQSSSIGATEWDRPLLWVGGNWGVPKVAAHAVLLDSSAASFVRALQIAFAKRPSTSRFSARVSISPISSQMS